MSRIPYAPEAEKVAKIQREAGWSEQSIAMYAEEQKAICCDEDGFLSAGVLMIGAGLSQNNERFGVFR